MSSSDKFIFENYEADLKKGSVEFFYKLIHGNEEFLFKETIEFEPPTGTVPEKLLDNLLKNLHLALGISYWKLFCPKKIELVDIKLSPVQAEFWNTVYTKGLGEFFFKNKIDFRGLVEFPSDESNLQPTSLERKDRSLIGVGGGKDSIVVVEMFKKEGKEFDLQILDTKIQREVCKTIGKEPVVTKRILDPQLFELNKRPDTYNGHVPVSLIYALLGVTCAVFYDYNSVVVGNEKSANYGNVEYLGEVINHQWSKSEEFEKLFQDYLINNITPDISYYSPLREMNELQITEQFVKYPEYFKVFSSCNRNFRINDKTDKKWCGECPKCLFVFIMLSAFLTKEEVLDIFGKNLLDDEKILSLFRELIGVKDFKPFECVGTPQETKEALSKIIAKGDFENTKLINYYKLL